MAIVPPTAYIVVSLQKKSKIERDAIQTTWCYSAPDAPNQADYEAWMQLYTNFLLNLNNFWPLNLATGSDTLKGEFWLLPANKGPIGAPTATVLRAPPTFGNKIPLPNEVSVCLSLEANMNGIPERGPGGIRPAARRRNRKFLGPWNEDAVDYDPVTNEPRPAVGLVDAILASYQNELVNNARGADWGPMVFSRTAWETHPVEKAWVDNAWDTQRRRGNDPTIKNSRNV